MTTFRKKGEALAYFLAFIACIPRRQLDDRPYRHGLRPARPPAWSRWHRGGPADTR